MSDQITLPRDEVELALDALDYGGFLKKQQAITALRAALAAPRPEPEKERAETDTPARRVADTEKSASSTPEVYPEKRHPGYIIGNHWLETAYERLCAGEAEDAILEDYELVREPRLRELRRNAERYRWLLNWLVWRGLLSIERCRIDSPASYGDWWILRKPKVIDGSSLIGCGKTEDAAIDAAMGDKT